jgi:hypothetical protein
MTIAITPLSTPMPSQNDPETFSDRMDVFLSELPVVVTQANAQNSENNALNASANAAATTATTKASEASASALAANAAAANAAAALGGQLWVSGTTYTAGYLVHSPLNGRSYRRLIAGAGTTDPSADTTNWVLLSVVVEQSDIGTDPNQIPLNQYLGALAYMGKSQFAIAPAASVSPAGLGELVVQLTNNTTLVFKVRGDDGVVRSNTLTLA